MIYKAFKSHLQFLHDKIYYIICFFECHLFSMIFLYSIGITLINSEEYLTQLRNIEEARRLLVCS